MSQDLSVTVAFEAVAAEYSPLLQAAGLPLGLLDPRDARTPDEHRRSLVRQLQAALPKSVPLSVRSDASRMPDSEFASTAAKVKQAVFEVASRGPELRAVTTRDRSGREITEFYGQKKAWMSQYSAPALLMRRCGARTF